MELYINRIKSENKNNIHAKCFRSYFSWLLLCTHLVYVLYSKAYNGRVNCIELYQYVLRFVHAQTQIGYINIYFVCSLSLSLSRPISPFLSGGGCHLCELFIYTQANTLSQPHIASLHSCIDLPFAACLFCGS